MISTKQIFKLGSLNKSFYNTCFATILIHIVILISFIPVSANTFSNEEESDKKGKIVGKINDSTQNEAIGYAKTVNISGVIPPGSIGDITVLTGNKATGVGGGMTLLGHVYINNVTAT